MKKDAGHHDIYNGVKDSLLASASSPKNHYIWLLRSQIFLGALYSIALLGHPPKVGTNAVTEIFLPLRAEENICPKQEDCSEATEWAHALQ